MVEEAIAKVPPQVAKRVQVEGKEDFEANLLPGVFANVLSNLFENAVSHGKAPHIEVQIDPKKRTVTVEDDGQGIPAEALPHIFRLDYSSQSLDPTRGTGLAFAQMVVQASGGTITCHSKHDPKKGYTRFTIDFGQG